MSAHMHVLEYMTSSLLIGVPDVAGCVIETSAPPYCQSINRCHDWIPHSV